MIYSSLPNFSQSLIRISILTGHYSSSVMTLAYLIQKKYSDFCIKENHRLSKIIFNPEAMLI